MLPILLMQTASGADYERMLQATDEAHRRYAERISARLEVFIGVKRGFYDWHATFNRIPMLRDLMDEGFTGWVIYIDADAVVAGPAFDIRSYLTFHADKLLIAASGTDAGAWDINAGIVMFNFGHPEARGLIHRWSDSFAIKITDADLKRARRPWGNGEAGDLAHNDQSLLQDVLREDAALVAQVLIDRQNVITYQHGFYIRQMVRGAGLDNRERLAFLEEIAGQTVAELRASASSLTALANSAGSDKGDRIGNAHGYTRAYELLFEQFRMTRFAMLEIGLLGGGQEVTGRPRSIGYDIPSIRM